MHWVSRLFSRLDDFIVEQVERCTEHDPFNTILIAFTESLPHCLFLGRLASYGDTGASAISATTARS